MEQPFTRSLRAPAPAVIGSHDIWSVGMTRVWQRRGGTIFIPIQTFFSLYIFAIFAFLLCPPNFSESYRGSIYRDQRVWIKVRANREDWDCCGPLKLQDCNIFWRDTAWKVSEKVFVLNSIPFRRNICCSLWDLQTSQSKKHIVHCFGENWKEFGGVGARFLWINGKVWVHTVHTGTPPLLAQDIPRKSQVPVSYYST